MHRLAALLLALALADASAQTAAPAMQGVHGRTGARDLSGDWRHIADPIGQVLDSRNPRRDLPNAEPDTLGGLVEYDWESARTLRVPGDWNSQDPVYLFYEGPIWYLRRFDAPAAGRSGAGARQFVLFEGANYATHVFLNGEKLAVHEGGFTPFQVEVTGRLRPAGNALVVAVDNRRRPGAIPALRTDWWNYGGLTRPVWLVSTPATTIHRMHVRYADPTGTQPGTFADAPEIVVEVHLDGPARSGQAVTVRIPELGVAERAVADAGGVASVRVSPRRAPALWSPEAPRRYEVVAEADTDRLRDTVGFRTVGVRGTEILLNGEPVFWRGVALHEERFGAEGGRAGTDAEYRALLEAARGLGANFVRLAHYPHGERMVQLADSLGLMVWGEIPVYWEDIDYRSGQTLAEAERMLRQMVERDLNRAAVVVWSVANETPVSEDRFLFLRHLIERTRAWDPSRLVSAALKSRSLDAAAADGAGAEGAVRALPANVQVVDDPLGALLDVLAVNTYVGWYGTAAPADIAAVEWRTPFAKPLVLSEFGADAVPGYRGPATTRWTEDYQADLLDQTIAVASRTPFIQGVMPWVLKDFRSPRRWHPRWQDFWNRKGLFSETGEEKLGAVVTRAWYARLAAGERPEAPLFIGGSTPRAALAP